MKVHFEAEPVESVSIRKSENVPPHMTVKVELHELAWKSTLGELGHVEQEADAQVKKWQL